MTQTTMAFIGAGNMAASIIGGLIAEGISPQAIVASDVNADILAALCAATGVRAADDNEQAVAQADIVVLAVKPQVMRQVVVPLADTVQRKKPLIVSIAAGITTDHLSAWLGDHVAIVRTMPNTPALLQKGATALYANPWVAKEQCRQVDQLMGAVGIVVWVDEEAQLDAVTAVSGSGPAYFFLVMEIMQTVGEQLGLTPDVAKLLVLQTALGATQMALDSDASLDQLRHQVTSPGGTTEAALNSLTSNGLHEMLAKALMAAHDRSRQLADSQPR